ncbi:GDSL-type esterase/lipase family protein [Muriicola soli]|uniref:G-D-S-L family lipolytic protein n=1 Tax=Muriicola soli TaxID=2507538 RepID=A0A411EAT2_9FLAO|nr:GDSL-type esterase/lipase family protein [Muriicola soli]QBA64637.1 G-D-S-L family lipolytic protein [Muriicola soli]
MRLDLTYFIFFLWVGCLSLSAQKNVDFKEEVEAITEKYKHLRNKKQQTVVFTGSSSIRLWDGLEQYFPEYRIINTGFGGSEAEDLLEYINPLILDYQPVKVFIYEGDNDIIFRRSPVRILKTTKKILAHIRTNLPHTEVVLIAVKPSPDRWHLRRRYQRLNQKFEKYASETQGVAFANVWDVMIKGEELNESLFIEDGLHMNEKGYSLWYEVLKPYLN